MRRLDLQKVKRNTLLLSCLVLTNCSYIQESSKTEGASVKAIVEPSANIDIKPTVKPVVSAVAKALLQQAKEAQKSKKIKLAISLATNAIEEKSDYAEAYKYRGFLYSGNKNYPAAIEDFQMLARLKPDNASAWGKLGWNFILNQQFPEAQQASEKAVALDSQSMAWTVNLGHSYLLQGDEELAYHYYSKSVPLIFNQKKFEQGPVADFELFIQYHWESVASQKALSWFHDSYSKFHQADEDYEHALKLFDQQQYKQAMELFQQALLFDKVLRNKKAIYGLLFIAKCHQLLQHFKLSVEFYQQALKLAEKTQGRNTPLVALIFNHFALLYESLGDYAQAKPLFLRALAIREEVNGPEHSTVATSLNNLAFLYGNLGYYAQAKPLYLRALAIREKINGSEHSAVATILNNLAGLYRSIGDYAQAKLLYLRTLAIDEKVKGPDHSDVAISLGNLAGLYSILGDYALAKPLYLRSLAICEKVYGPEHSDVATSLNNLASLYGSLGNYALAKPLYLRALAIFEKVYGSEHGSVAISLNNLAGLYIDLGDYAQAKLLYLRSLAINEKVYGPEHAKFTMSLNNLAELHVRLGDYALAKPLLLRAYRFSISSHQPELLGRVQYNLSFLHKLLKAPDTAVFYGKQAINTIQSLRAKNIKLDNILQKSFLKEKDHVYRNLANLLIDQNRLAEAEQVLSMLKEEEYFDFIRRDSEEDERATLASYTPFEQKWKLRYDKIKDQLVHIGVEYSVLQQKKQRSLDEETRFKALQTDMDVAREAFLTTLDELDTAFSQLTAEQAKAYGAKNLAFVENEQETLANLQHGAVLIHTILTEESLHLLLTTKETQVARKSSISAAELKKKIQAFRKVLKDPLKNPQPLAQELFRLLVKPIQADLEQANAETLMWSLDGLLRYIPMAALHDGEQYLIEKYAIALYTAAARGNLDKQPTPQWKVAGLGTSQAYGSFDPLGFVPDELDGIIKLDEKDSSGVLPGVIHLNKQFTAEEFKNLLARRYPVVHIASHFKLQPGNNAASYLLLGDGTQLTLSEFNKRSAYKFRGVDLLTLSACNTAMGELGQGQEVEGFAVLAQKRGAKGVLATLWPVADQSTGQFMQNFYRIRTANPDNSKADALRQAQVDFIKGKTKLMSGLTKRGGIDPDEPQVSQVSRGSLAQYSHPYYWAPFILMGNWL